MNCDPECEITGGRTLGAPRVERDSNRFQPVASVHNHGEENAADAALSSPPPHDRCLDMLNTLGKVLAAVLVNAQVMDGKLPSYSRSKRYMHEIERHAQRGAELVKRLIGLLGEPSLPQEDVLCRTSLASEQVSSFAGATAAVAIQEPTVESDGPTFASSSPQAHAAPAFLSRRSFVPHTNL